MKERPQALVIYNPESGLPTDRGAWLGEIIDKFCKELHYHVTVHATRPDMSSDEMLDEDHQKFDLIVAAGGDGTIRLVLGALADKQSDVPVALIPFGTGNQLARNLGAFDDNLLVDPVQLALDLIIKGHTRKIDIGKMNGHPFCVGVGAGPLSDAVAAPSRVDKANWGVLAYVGSMMQTLASPPVHLRVTADGDCFDVKASGLFVTNVGNLGITVSETAELDDALLDLFIITLGEFSDYLDFGFRFASAVFAGEAPYYVKKVRNVKVESLRGMLPANVDGDFIGTTPMNIEVVPRAVRVVCSRG